MNVGDRVLILVDHVPGVNHLEIPAGTHGTVSGFYHNDDGQGIVGVELDTPPIDTIGNEQRLDWNFLDIHLASAQEQDFEALKQGLLVLAGVEKPKMGWLLRRLRK